MGERYLDSVLEDIKLGIFKIVISQDKKIKPKMYANDIIYSMLGASKEKNEEELYLYWISRVDKEYIKYIDGLFETNSQSQSIEIEYLWEKASKEYVYIRMSGCIVKHKDGLTEIQGYQQNITHLFEMSEIEEKKYNIRDPYKYRKYANAHLDVYDEIYEVDLETNNLTTIFFRSKKNQTIEEDGNVFDIIKNHVHPDDQHIMLDIFKSENIKKMRRDKWIKRIEFRSKKNNGGYEWLRMNCMFVMMNERKNMLLYGYSIQDRKQTRAATKEKEAIISAIVADHTAVLDVNVNTGEVNVLKYKIGDYGRLHTLTEMTDNLVNFYATEEENEKINHFLSVQNLKHIIKHNLSLDCDIQLKTDVFGYGWLRISAISSEKIRDRVFILLKNISKDYILDILMNQYIYKNCEDLYYINCKTNDFLCFEVERLSQQNFSSHGSDYIAHFNTYVDRFVVEEDQPLVREKMLPVNVIDDLEKKGFSNISYNIIDEQGNYRRKFVQFQYYDKKNQKILLMRSDITENYMLDIEEKKMISEIKKDAITDYLTGIYNRFGLEKEFNEYLNVTESTMSAFILMDLDNFKSVNDLLGHQTGDIALKDVAKILKQNFREQDLVGRLGGDEFVIIMRNIKSLSIIPDFMKRILRALNLKYNNTIYTVEIAASIGIAIFPQNGKTFDELYQKADKALYSVKNNCKNGCTIYGENVIYKDDSI